MKCDSAKHKKSVCRGCQKDVIESLGRSQQTFKDFIFIYGTTLQKWYVFVSAFNKVRRGSTLIVQKQRHSCSQIENEAF